MAARACDPRVRVAAVIPHNDGIVMVRQRRGDHEYHLLPGGGVEAGESIGDALAREVSEETGAACELVAPLFVNDSIDPAGSRHVIQLTFLARFTEPVTGFVSSDPRVVGVEVVPVERLHELDLRPPLAAQLIEAAASHYRLTAAYVGSLWVEEHGITGAGTSARTDG